MLDYARQYALKNYTQTAIMQILSPLLLVSGKPPLFVLSVINFFRIQGTHLCHRHEHISSTSACTKGGELNE